MTDAKAAVTRLFACVGTPNAGCRGAASLLNTEVLAAFAAMLEEGLTVTLSAPGPRDWSPSEPSANFSTPGANRTRARGGGRLSGWLALLCGLGALAVALVQPNDTHANGLQSGFIASSIGIFAIALGFSALRQRRAGLPAATLVARGGILFGAVGTAAMAYALAAFLLVPSGVYLPALPSFAASGASPLGLVLGGPPPQQPNSDPLSTPVVPADAPPIVPPVAATSFASPSDEQLALAQTVGTAAYVLSLQQGADTAWPDSVAFASDGATLVSGAGTALAVAPAGAQLLYTRSSDGTQYSLTLVGAQYATSASFDSLTGTVSY